MLVHFLQLLLEHGDLHQKLSQQLQLQFAGSSAQ